MGTGIDGLNPLERMSLKTSFRCTYEYPFIWNRKIHKIRSKHSAF
jgi:hypothetical protein